MDYEFFDSLTAEEARALLNGFLESQKKALDELEAVAATEGLKLDYSLPSLPAVVKWLMKGISVHRVPVPEEEPWWFRQAHPTGLTDFDDASRQ